MGFGGGGGSSSVAGSSDVALSSPVNQDVLTYDSSTSKWKNAAPTGGGGSVTSVAGKTGVVTLVKGDVGLGNVDNTSDVAKPISTATQTALSGKVDTSDSRLTDTRTPTDGTVTTAKIADANVTLAKLSASVQTSLGKADSALQSAPVTSVASKTGVVTLVKGDVGLGNVDNTADTAKPISTATQTALNGKANTTHVHDGADITTGTIGAARLPAATTTAAGVVQLATTSMATTGTDTATAVTPQGLKSAITASFPTVLFVDDLSQIPPGTPVDTLVVVRTA